MNKTEWFEVIGVQTFPQAFVLILHNRQNGKFVLQHTSRYGLKGYDSSWELLSMVKVSEFGPYFMEYADNIQTGLYAQLISTIGYAAKYTKQYKKATNNPFPRAFKRLAKKLIRAYFHQIQSTDFLTRGFIGKVYGMLRQIWLHARAYFRWEASMKQLRCKLQKYRPIESFGFEC